MTLDGVYGKTTRPLVGGCPVYYHVANTGVTVYFWLVPSPTGFHWIIGVEKDIGTNAGFAYLQSPDRRPPNAVEPQTWRFSAAGSFVPDDDALMRGELLLIVI